VAAVQRELVALLAARGRRVVKPQPRQPDEYDPMQYGVGDEVARWGLAGFPGAEGWVVLRSAPLELLMLGERPMLLDLATRLGTCAFQFNVYDGTSDFLLEVDASERIERSGLVNHVDRKRYWGGAPPPEDRMRLRFELIDIEPMAARAQAENPGARLSGFVMAPPPKRKRGASRLVKRWERAIEENRAKLLRWIESGRAELGAMGWSAHPSEVLRTLVMDDPPHLGAEDAIAPAIMGIFGGPNAKACDNLFVVETLVPHGPFEIDGGFVIYAER
jgi:hypothetical protein